MNIKHYIRIELNSAENVAYNATFEWIDSLMRSPEVTGDIAEAVNKAWEALSDLDDFLIVEG